MPTSVIVTVALLCVVVYAIAKLKNPGNFLDNVVDDIIKLLILIGVPAAIFFAVSEFISR